MGLSGRKVKQRIPQDPRNLSWADDASRFGSTYLSKLGFDHTDKTATLGTSGAGLTEHLKVHHKLDMLGIGAQHAKDPNGIAWKQNRDFENLLKRLNGNAEDGIDSAPIDGFHRARIDEPAADVATAGSETEGRDEERMVERERKGKKKRLRTADETAKAEERKQKKRRKIESTATTPANEPMEAGPSDSNSPALGTSTVASSKPRPHGRAHRARFIASKRLTATSSVAVAEILGISSSTVTPLSVSGVATPEDTSQVEYDEHRHLTVSSKSVADYFKEKMLIVVSKPRDLKTEVDEAPRGGIGSRLGSCGHDEVEDCGGSRGGIGMGLLAKMSSAGGVTEILTQAEETPKGKVRRERKQRSEGCEGGANHRPKKRSKKKPRTVSD